MKKKSMQARIFWRQPMLMLLAVLAAGRITAQAPPRTIEILADRDSRYKIDGQPHPTIFLKAGERVLLRITARKAQNMNRDGSVHGFTMLRASDEAKVPGWDLLLKPGTQDVELTAPAQPGEYRVVCTVICSQDHEGMHMKVVVTQ